MVGMSHIRRPSGQRSVQYTDCGHDCHQVTLRGFTAAELVAIAGLVGVIIYAARR
jgi:hypothetical protein